MTGEQNTQLQQASAVLSELRPLITTEDRKLAVKDLDLSDLTISRYLKGEAKKLDTAMKLIGLFRKRIEEREKALA